MDALSLLTNNKNQPNKHESTSTMETMSEIFDIKEVIEGTFLIDFNIIDYL